SRRKSARKGSMPSILGSGLRFFRKQNGGANGNDENTHDRQQRHIDWNLVKIHDTHLYANEGQNGSKSVFEIMKVFFNAGECEIQRSQAEYGEYVGRVDDESVVGNSEDGRDGVNSKYEIRGFNEDHHEEQRRSPKLAIAPYKEVITFK